MAVLLRAVMFTSSKQKRIKQLTLSKNGYTLNIKQLACCAALFDVAVTQALKATLSGLCLKAS